MRQTLITSILLLTFLWPANFTYAAESGCLRPVAAGERDEEVELKREVELRILLASETGMRELLARFDSGTFGVTEWFITIRILDEAFCKPAGNTMMERFIPHMVSFSKSLRKKTDQLTAEGEGELSDTLCERFNRMLLSIAQIETKRLKWAMEQLGQPPESIRQVIRNLLPEPLAELMEEDETALTQI